MTRFARTLIASCLLAVALPLASCGSMPDFDPTDLIPNDPFGTKKKLPGARKPVFPEGVPGVSQGIPSDLIKGNQPAPDTGLAGAPPAGGTPTPPATQQAATTPPEEFTPAPREKAKPKPKPKPKQATAERPPTAVTVGPSQGQQPQQQPQQQGGVQWPEPPPQRSSPASGVQWPDPPPTR